METSDFNDGFIMGVWNKTEENNPQRMIIQLDLFGDLLMKAKHRKSDKRFIIITENKYSFLYLK